MTEVIFEGGNGVNHGRGAQQMAQTAQITGLVVHGLGAVLVRSRMVCRSLRRRLGDRLMAVRGMIVRMGALGRTMPMISRRRCHGGTDRLLLAPGIAQDHAPTGQRAQWHACRENNQQDGFLPGPTHVLMIGRAHRHVQDPSTPPRRLTSEID